jgi:AmmeMemoRadiSam system protein A
MTRTSHKLFSLFFGVVLMIVPDCQALSKEPGASPAPVRNGASSQQAGKDLPGEVKSFLLKLARQSLEASVTLTINGNLRGCIGYIEGIKPLFEAVIDNAENAALSDPRFPSVTPGELSRIRVEISVLTHPEPLDYKDPQDLLNKLMPNIDGIILQNNFHQSTFLPQVWEQLPDKVQFLEHLSIKGGMPADGWKTATVKRYRAIHFQEQ